QADVVGIHPNEAHDSCLVHSRANCNYAARRLLMKFLLTTLLAAALIGLLAWKLCFPGGGPPNPLPILESHWDDQLYRLDDDEDLRFIPPPFLVRRASEFKDFIRMRLTITGNGQRCYHMTSQGVV